MIFKAFHFSPSFLVLAKHNCRSNLLQKHKTFFCRNRYSTDLKTNILNDTRMEKYLQSLVKEFEETKKALAKENNKPQLQNKILNLQSLITLNEQLEKYMIELKEFDEFVSDAESQGEKDFGKSVSVERENYLENIEQLKLAIFDLMIPPDFDDDKNIIMELTAGVGGQEAMLFAHDLFNMYLKYAAFKGWEAGILKQEETGIGGLRCAHLEISGHYAYKSLKYEAGVHRVQRIPKTEKSGRIHTSTVTVAILPQPTEIDISLPPKDLRIEFKSSSGPGGQNVNKTESCVRITHIPTGITVESQQERFQYMNQEIAFKSLRARLYQLELQKRTNEENLSRKHMIGTAARSDKVRTYNFNQDRITDHRIHQNLSNMDIFLEGSDKLDNLLNDLQNWSKKEVWNKILEKYNS